MVFGRTSQDWLVVQLIERCKEGSIVDRDDLSLISSLNIQGYVLQQGSGAFDYGSAVQDLGKAVAAKGGELVVPDLSTYASNEVLRAPSDWFDRWSVEETIPSTHDLWAEFDMFSACTPEGSPLVIDGPGGHSFENWMNYCNERDRILEQRRLRRVAAGW